MATITGTKSESQNENFKVGFLITSVADGLSAAGTTQATGTQLTSAFNTISTAAAGSGVNLPQFTPGLSVTVVNNGANALLVYPFQGSTDTINGNAATVGVLALPGSVSTFGSTVAGAITVQADSSKMAAFNTNTATSAATLTAANISGGAATVDLAMTGTLAGAAVLTLPTVASLVAAIQSPTVGTSYRLRIINESSGNFAWTVTTNTGWTVTGTMSIAQNTWRDFVVTLTSLAAATIQNVGVGTFS